jgi:hypothetical protein
MMKFYSFILAILFFGTISLQGPPDTLWTRIFGGEEPGCNQYSGDVGRSVQPTNDGGFIVGGWTHSFGIAGADIWLIRTNELGDTLWTCTFGDSANNVGYSFQQVPNNGLIISGFNYEGGGGG